MTVIGVTVGDPAGIGPEVALKAVLSKRVRRVCTPVLIGSAPLLRDQAQELGLSLDHVRICNVSEHRLADVFRRQDSALGGSLSMFYLEAAVAGLKKGEWDAVATAPISKASWHMAGYNYPGHTEFFARSFNVSRYLMAFYSQELCLALVSWHIPLAQVSAYLTVDKIVGVLTLLHAERRMLGYPDRLRIGVCGLNPHAGEHGNLGHEEQTVICPALEKARGLGIDVQGPFPADTFFVESRRKHYDVVVAMYHDQGLIPFKMLAFEKGVNVTLGLPYVRTSADHGTAYDIVGQNKASAVSMEEAIMVAARMVKARML